MKSNKQVSNHKEILKKYKDCCANCGIKNYTVVTMSQDVKWIPLIKHIPTYYEDSRKVANELNQEEGSSNWSVIVLRVYEIKSDKTQVPLCVMCAGKPTPQTKTEKSIQNQLF